MPSLDGSDDFVWVLCPGKGLWVCVGVVEEAVDGIFEFTTNTATTLRTVLPTGQQRGPRLLSATGVRGYFQHRVETNRDVEETRHILAVGRTSRQHSAHGPE